MSKTTTHMRKVLEDGNLALHGVDVLSDHLLAQDLLAGHLLEGLSREFKAASALLLVSPSSVELTLTFKAR